VELREDNGWVIDMGEGNGGAKGSTREEARDFGKVGLMHGCMEMWFAAVERQND
jgi:hypothetical protein